MSSNELNSFSLICKDSLIDGKTMIIPSHLKIGGTVYQNIDCGGKLVVASTASIRGNIKARELLLEGDFEGVIWVAGTVIITSSASVSGHISAGKLKVEEGAWCQFDATVDDGAAERLEKAELDIQPGASTNRSGKKLFTERSEPPLHNETDGPTSEEMASGDLRDEEPELAENRLADRFW